ncbi:MAG TPA: nucleotidyltransferase domain-containing protein [Chloroflexota bacterium]
MTARTIAGKVRSALPHLGAAEAADVTRIVDTLLHVFQPEAIYVFGSQARGTPSRHSDVDLLVVVPDAGEFPHHLAQQAYRVIGHHVVPADIVFMSGPDFEWRADVTTSLPATVLREGKLLYGAA